MSHTPSWPPICATLKVCLHKNLCLQNCWDLIGQIAQVHGITFPLLSPPVSSCLFASVCVTVGEPPLVHSAQKEAIHRLIQSRLFLPLSPLADMYNVLRILATVVVAVVSVTCHNHHVTQSSCHTVITSHTVIMSHIHQLTESSSHTVITSYSHTIVTKCGLNVSKLALGVCFKGSDH